MNYNICPLTILVNKTAPCRPDCAWCSTNSTTGMRCAVLELAEASRYYIPSVLGKIGATIEKKG